MIAPSGAPLCRAGVFVVAAPAARVGAADEGVPGVGARTVSVMGAVVLGAGALVGEEEGGGDEEEEEELGEGVGEGVAGASAEGGLGLELGGWDEDGLELELLDAVVDGAEDDEEELEEDELLLDEPDESLHSASMCICAKYE